VVARDGVDRWRLSRGRGAGKCHAAPYLQGSFATLASIVATVVVSAFVDRGAPGRVPSSIGLRLVAASRERELA
jgi:hypothetical protein